MSSAGKCPKALSAERLDYPCAPLPEFVTRSADEGKWHEARLIQELRDKGFVISFQQLEVTLEFPNYLMVGHIEGTIQWPFPEADDYLHLKPFDLYLLEIKSMSMYQFNRWMKGRLSEYLDYADQVTAYWEATKDQVIPTLFTGIVYLVKDRNNGYLDKNVLLVPPSDFNLIRAKLDAVEMSVANNELYEADFDPSSIECKRCGFRDSICLPNKEVLEPVIEAALIEATNQVREGRALKEQGIILEEEGKQTLGNHAEAISPDTKHTYIINEMRISRYPGHKHTYPNDVIEDAFSEDIYKPLQKHSNWWTVKPTDLAKDIENGE